MGGSLLCKVTIKSYDSYADTMYAAMCGSVWRSFHLHWPWTTAMRLFKCAKQVKNWMKRAHWRAHTAQIPTCYANGTSMSPSATPATQSGAAPRATNRAQTHHQSQPSGISATPATRNKGWCEQVPRLPRKTTVDVSKCHACHAKCRGASPVPRLPRKTKVDVAKCHACHAKWRLVWASAQWHKRHACHAKRRLPCKTTVNVSKCHACHANGTSMSPIATPATQSGAAPRATNRAQARHQSQPSGITRNEGWCEQVPRLPRKTTVNVSKRHACHAKCRGERWCVTKWCVKDGVWQSCVWKMVCEKWCVKKLCMWKMVCVCERWCVTKRCVTKWCVKDSVCGVWQRCVWKMVCDKVVCERWCVKDGLWQSGVWKMVCDKVVCERWCVKDGVKRGEEGAEEEGGGGGEEAGWIQNQKQEPHTKMWEKWGTRFCTGAIWGPHTIKCIYISAINVKYVEICGGSGPLFGIKCIVYNIGNA